MSFFFNPWASKIASVSCRLLPSCLLYASHRKNVDPSRKHEPVFTISVESKWCVCFFFYASSKQDPFCVMSVKMLYLFFFFSQNVVSVFFFFLASSKQDRFCAMTVESKCCVCFFLSLGQAGSLLCHDGRVKMLCLFFF